MLDTVRDSESARALPNIVRPLVDLLRNGEPSFQKDTLEYQYRRILFDILNRLPVNESVRVHVPLIFGCMLHVLRHDNEENGATACKTLVDLVRSYRSLTEEVLTDFLAIFQEGFQNMKGLVNQYLSEESPQLDGNVALPALRSFKVLGEMGMVMVIMSQIHRALVSAAIQGTTTHAFEVLSLESPTQHKARTEYEAMGGIWAGMAPTIRNPGVYSDFTHAQIKVSKHQLSCYERNKSHYAIDAILPGLYYAIFRRPSRLIWGDSDFKCSSSSSGLSIKRHCNEKGQN
jgi:transformation/transcription domain-associated protein